MTEPETPPIEVTLAQKLDASMGAGLARVEEALRRLDIIHQCAVGKLEDVPDLPCQVDEMTERERQIYHVAMVWGGALLAIRDWADLAYPLSDPATFPAKEE